MPPYKIKESFEWIAPEFKVVDSGKNTIRIKGIALHGDVISKNNRRYAKEELKRAARTFIGKPLTVNHDPTKIAGNIIWMEYSDDDLMEYIADVKKQPYVDMVRNKSTDIKGVSVEASYLHNRCFKCGEKFYDEPTFRDHMYQKHMIKIDPTTEPHGMFGTALSLVLTPEVPGYPGSTVELMETWKHNPSLSQLLETVIQTKKEEEQMAKPSKVPYKHREIREQDETPPTPPCPDGWHEVDGKCVKDEPTATEQDEHGCEPDQEWDGTKCVPKQASETDAIGNQPPATPTPAPNTGEQAEGEPEKLSCPDGYHLVTDDSGNQTCEPDIPPPPMDKPVAEAADVQPQDMAPAGTGDTVQPSDKEPCPEGQHRDPTTGLCVVDTTVVTPAPNIQTETVKVPTLLKLGEPFAGYKDMDDCISKNPDKEDPAAYCASIMRKVEKEPAAEIKESHNIYETQKQITKSLQEVQNRGIVRDAQIAEKVNSLNRALAKTLTETSKAIKHINETMQKNQASTMKFIKTVQSAANYNLIAETKKHLQSTKSLQESMKKEFGKLAESYTKLQEYTNKQLTKLATSIAETNRQAGKPAKAILQEIANIKQRIQKVTELATEQKKDFETILATADKNVEGLKETVKTLEQWKTEKEQQIKETTQKEKDQETQTKALKEVLEPLQTQIDNLESRLKGNFKNKSPDAIPEPEQLETDNLPYNPEK